ncbi:MAG TPA: permease-like cell division protein FtsX [Actinoplanes sp.]|jgi:hypothetical protein
MEQDLREHFDQAVGDDPGDDPGEMARLAIIEGGRLRRRRHQLVAGGVAASLVLAFGAVPGIDLLRGTGPAEPSVTIAAAMMPVVAPSCVQRPVETDATDAVIFLAAEVTDPRRAAVETALRGDPRIQAVLYESRESAFQRFQARWESEPDLLAAVSVEQFPESFRLRLVTAAQFTALRAQYAGMAGIEQIIGRRCSADAPVGGLL